MSTMLGVYQKQYINCYSDEMGGQMLDTLVEVIQGPCKDNQRSLVSSKAIDICKDIINIRTNEKRELKMKGFNDDNIEMIDGLKQNAAKLLVSIIEGPIDAEIMKAIKKTLDDFAVIFDRMNSIYEKFVSEVLNLDPESASLS
jgi:RyR and IP3R Homology associated